MRTPLTYGLTHIAIKVKDLERTKAFYCTVFEMKVMYDNEKFVQLTTHNCRDILVFEKNQRPQTKTGGIIHFGFRLRNAGDMDEIVNRVLKSGGKVKSQGEFVPGSPYIFFNDPDGYEVEVWYEVV